MENEFYQLAVILVLAVAGGAIAVSLRQPLIIAFIVVGVIVGPAALGWVQARDQIDLLAQVGVAILLFLVGLKLDVHLVRNVGPVALLTGIAQVIVTSVSGFGLALALGLGTTPALYVAAAVTFSSTIIIIKLLSDLHELEELHGRIAVGVLIVQDILVILVMVGLATFGRGEGALTREVVGLVAKSVGFFAALLVMVRFVLPRLLDRVARSPELLVLFGISWAVAVAAGGDWIGLNKEVGAFVAGLALASTPYRDALGARLVTLRDFMLLFFFIDLGARLQLGEIGSQIVPAIVLSAVVLLFKPLIVLVVMGRLGYRSRVSLRTALTLGQISEFSLILAALGLQLGHIGTSTVALITAVGVITISLSSYVIVYSRRIYGYLAPLARVFERPHPAHGDGSDAIVEYDVIVFGVGRFGSSIIESLTRAGRRVLAVDFDPHALARLREHGVDVLYGDAEEPAFVAALPLASTRAVLSTIPDVTANLVLLEELRRLGFRGTVALTAHNERNATMLEQAERVMVLRPFAVAAARVLEGFFGEEPRPQS